MSTGKSTHEEIVNRAHQLWERAGRPEGRDLEFWLRAEEEVHRNPGPDNKAAAHASSNRSAVPASTSARGVGTRVSEGKPWTARLPGKAERKTANRGR